ncbi:hypothetical protein FAZ15_03615 [Sphingobacterium olei]|uniref:Collagen-like protein n=1 Tax=Sphingobacterium olei TaxID=2571155 RepID=A0A4U0P7Q0_9SPHI|nr:hypothetical protein [Sphingobacterium olei]TJZ63380.1 hypothetical protein FAZ15_03615 [Sphingobacterium olei]
MKKLLILLSILALLAGCGKDGSPGQDGQNGEQGPAGTANVVASNWFPGKRWTTVASDFKHATYTITQGMLSEVGASTFTAFLESGGTMIMYMKAEDFIYPLPHLGGAMDKTNVRWFPYPIDSPNDIILQVYTNDRTRTNTFYDDPTTFDFRYVLIPAGRQVQAAKGFSRDIIDVKTLPGMSYTEAKKLFDWED